MSESTDLTYYQRKREAILNRAKDYYENGKDEESKQEINTETYLKKKKNKRREYGKNRYHIMSEEKKKILKKNFKKIIAWQKKSQYNNE